MSSPLASSETEAQVVFRRKQIPGRSLGAPQSRDQMGDPGAAALTSN